jgi:ribosomal protein L4
MSFNPNPYIYQLPEDVQKLALKRQYEQGYRKDRMVRLNTFNFEGVFDWNKTPEGMEFWELINIQEYDGFYEKYPNGEGF